MTAIQKQQFEMAPQGKFTNFYTLIFFSLLKIVSIQQNL